MSAVVSCVVEGCPFDAGPEGFCPEHEAEAAAERQATMQALQLQRETEGIVALHRLARRIVAHEERARARARSKRAKARRRVQKASRSRNRR